MSNVAGEAHKVKSARVANDTPYKTIDLHGAKVWPEPYPTMTGTEAVAACKRLWRKFAGRAWPGTWKIGRGNHRIYPRGTVMVANPGLGWPRLVHDLSHALYQQMTLSQGSERGPHLYVNRERRPILSKAVHDNYRTAKQGDHTQDHALLEKAMIKMVIESGWLDGALRKPIVASKPSEDVPVPEKAKPGLRERNEAKVDAAIDRWTGKLNQAKKAVIAAEKKLKEFEIKKRYYDRQRTN